MSPKLNIETNVRRLIQYIDDISQGNIQIPAFQRDFVWTQKDKLELFDSLKRGYPIGSILLWKPGEQYGYIEKFGPFRIPAPTESRTYILDGFQRLSTLFGCLVNPHKAQLAYDEQEWRREYALCYDLASEEFFFPRSHQPAPPQVYVYQLVDTFEFLSYSRKLSQEIDDAEQVDAYVQRAQQLSTTLLDFRIAYIEISGGSIEDAVDIFARINSRGTPISPDWMVSALSWNQDQNFRLGTEIDQLIQDLEFYNFGGIKRELILQGITQSFGKPYFDQAAQIETLAKRKDFVSVTRQAIKSIKRGVEFLFAELGVTDVKLLPYNSQLIFITDFFHHLPSPTPAQLEMLKRWFWTTTYAGYFTIYSLSRQRAAYEQFHAFLRGETADPIYNDQPEAPFQVGEFPGKIYFGSVRAKALVLLLLQSAYTERPLAADQIRSMEVSYLFADMRDDKGSPLPEGAIARLHYTQDDPILPPTKQKDMSFLLSAYKPEYQRLFLTPDMAQEFVAQPDSQDVKRGILEKRKRLIMEAEEALANKLGLEYRG